MNAKVRQPAMRDSVRHTSQQLRALNRAHADGRELADTDDSEGTHYGLATVSAEMASCYAAFIAHPSVSRWQKLEAAMMLYQSYANTAQALGTDNQIRG